VPPVTTPGPGIDPTGPRGGNDVITRFDILDSNSFSYLALPQSVHYRNTIDWSGAAACRLNSAQASERVP